MALNYDALTALTRKKYIPKLVDNIFKSNPLLTYLKKRKQHYDGGYKIVEPLIYGDVNGITSYKLYDTITYDTSIPISAAEFEPKNIVAPIIISHDEELKNSGEVQVINLLKSKIRIVEETLKSSLTTMLYSDGTGNSGKDMDGLGIAIEDTGTYGGIDRDTYTWWQSKVSSNNPSSPGTAATLDLDNMVRLFLSISDGNDQPDLIICGLATWHEYYKQIETKALLTTELSKTLANYGFQTLEFMSKPITADPNCPEGKMYFLNSKYLKFRVHSKADFATTKFRADDTRLAKKQEILLTGNITINNCRRFGVLEDIDYTEI